MPDLPNQNPEGFTRKPINPPVVETPLMSVLPARAAVAEPTGFKAFFRANKWYFFAIVVGIVIIGVLGYFAFRKTPAAAPKQANVAINISVPQTVPSGGEAVYTMTVQNNDTQKLVNMQLELIYPDGETYDTSVPTAQDLAGSLFTVPDLVPGQNAVVIVKAKITGNVGDQKTLNVKLLYSYENSSAQFEQDQTAAVQLAASNIAVNLQGPANTSNSQLVVYTISYQNNSGADVQNARVSMDYPDGFVFASASPPPDLGNNTWEIGTFAQTASSTITVQGSFSSANPGESKTATANFLILGADGNYFTQNSSDFVTQISSLPLLVTQSVQGQASTSGVANPGDTLTFNVSYQNNASVAATGVNIEVDLNSKVVDPSSISSQGAQVNNSSIIWNAAGVPQLASLLPNQSGQLSFNLKVNNPAARDASKNLSIVSAIKIQSNEYQTAFPGNQLTVKISSPMTISTVLGFSSGSLPPQVGKSTNYEVTISLTNSSNDFSNGLLTLFLPAGGFVPGSINSAEAQNATYDSSTDKLTWNVGSLPANTGRFSQPRTLSFALAFNPGAASANQAAVLLKTISFSATDLYTTQSVSATTPDIRTSDIQGQSGFGDGIVQP